MMVRWTHDPKEPKPPSFVRLGMLTIHMPDAETQLRGFETKYARRLARHIPNYKLILR